VRLVSVDAFGMIGMGNTYIEIAMLISTLGSISILQTYTTYFIARKEYGALRHILVRYTGIILAFGTVISIITFLFSRKISTLLYNTEIMNLPLKVVAILLLINLVQIILATVLRASKQFRLFGQVQIASAALNLVFTFFFIYYVGNWISKSDDYLVAASFVGSALMMVATSVFILIKNRKSIVKLRKTRSEKPASKNLLKFGATSASLVMISMWSLYINKIAIGYYLTPDQWGYFYIAVIVVNVIMVFKTVLNIMVYPALVDAHSRRDYNDFSLTMHIILKYWTLFFIPLTLVFTLFLPYVIPVIWGVDYIAAVLTAQVLMISFGIQNYSSIYASALTAIEKPHKQFLPSIIYVAMNIILALIFVYYFGILGAAITILITEILNMLISRYIFLNDETMTGAGVNDSYMKNLLKVLGIQLSIIVLFFMPFYYILTLVPNLYIQFIVAFIFGVLLSFLSISYIFGRGKLSSEETERFFLLFPISIRPLLQWMQRVSFNIWD
jgi:O-antigen/teichoic acid export membrane protein